MSKSLKICKELALTQPSVFKFQGLKMDSVYAHGANSFILTARVGSIEQGDFFNFLDLTCVPPGAEIGMHTHANDNQEIYIIISGEAMMNVDGTAFKVSRGDVIVNQPGGSHSLKNSGPTSLQMVVIEVGQSRE